MAKEKKSSTKLATSFEEALSNVVDKNDTRSKITKRLKELPDSSAKSIQEAFTMSMRDEICETFKEKSNCPEDVFLPIWRKVNRLLNELKIPPNAASFFLKTTYKDQLPDLEFNQEKRVQIVKSLILLNEVLRAIPGSHYIFQKLKQSLIYGNPLEAGHSEEGTMMMADISGFTSMMEQNAKKGKIGVANVHKRINEVFDHLSSVAVHYGGLIMKYGGDAMTIYFHGREAENRAKACAVGMQEVMKKIEDIGGLNPLKLSIGLARDLFYLGIIGGKERRELVIGGKGVENMENAEKEAKPGEIIMCYPNQKLEFVKDIPDIERGLDSDWGLNVKDLFVDNNRYLEKNPIKNADTLCRSINQLSATLLSFAPQGTSDQLFKTDTAPEWSTGSTAVFIKFNGIDYNNPTANDQFNDAYRTISRLTMEYKGRINKFGPSMLILFSPLGKTGGSARRAYECANQILAKCLELNKDLQLKIGIATGNMMVGKFGPSGEKSQYEYTVLGDPVNFAARLMAKSEVGEILIAPEIYKATHDRLSIIDERKDFFKGKEGELPYYSAHGWQDIHGLDIPHYLDTAGSIYGREKELRHIKTLIQDTFDNKSKSLLIEGEAGIGKTKLIKHAIKECALSGMNVYGAAAEIQNQKQAFGLWKNIIGSMLNLDPTKDINEQNNDAKDFLKKMKFSKDHEADSILALLGFKNKEFSFNLIQESIRTFLKKLSKHMPLTIALEDLHWSDVESLEVLKFLVRSLENDRILLISNTRPSKNIDETFSKKIDLKGLKEKDIEDIAKDILTREDNLLEGKMINKDFYFQTQLRKYIYKASEGNPLYAEEIVFALIRAGFLTYGKFEFIKQLPSEAHISDDLQSLMEGRINFLTTQGIFNEQTRDVLHILSVTGNEAPPGLLENLCKNRKVSKAVLEKELVKLIENRFIESQKGELQFRHDLIREAVEKMLSPYKLIDLHKEAILYLENKKDNNIYIERIFQHTIKALKNYGFSNDKPNYSELIVKNPKAQHLIENIWHYGLEAMQLLKNQTANQRSIIDYSEKALAVADAIGKNTKEKRKLYLEITKQLTSIGADNEIKKALETYEDCLEMSKEFAETPDELFKQLDIIGKSMETRLMLAGREPGPFVAMYNKQKLILKTLKENGFKENLEYRRHELLAERNLIFSRIYEAYELRQKKDKSGSSKRLNETLPIIEKALIDTPLDETELRTWFLYLKARIFQDLEDHENSYKTSNKDLGLYRSKSNQITSTTLIKDLHIVNISECFNLGQKLNNTALIQTAIDKAKQNLYFFRNRNELKAECLTLEKLAHFAYETENWEDCIKWAHKCYIKSKDHKVSDRQCFALANLAGAYAHSGQKEKGLPYLEELIELKDKIEVKSIRDTLEWVMKYILDPHYKKKAAK